MVMLCKRHNKRYACKKRRSNRSSSTPSIKIRPNQSFRHEPYLPLKYFHESFSLTIYTAVMSQQSQRTDATKVDSQRKDRLAVLQIHAGGF